MEALEIHQYIFSRSWAKKGDLGMGEKWSLRGMSREFYQKENLIFALCGETIYEFFYLFILNKRSLQFIRGIYALWEEENICIFIKRGLYIFEVTFPFGRS